MSIKDGAINGNHPSFKVPMLAKLKYQPIKSEVYCHLIEYSMFTECNAQENIEFYTYFTFLNL